MIRDVAPYYISPNSFNKNIPANLYLVCGDNLLELQAEAIRQTSQLSIPTAAWKLVLSWIKDLTGALAETSGDRDSVFIIDCNPSFAIYTQLALVAAEYLVIPFTADDSSRRGIENVVALTYGIAPIQSAVYSKISFSDRAKEERISVPKLHTFVSNRQTIYEGKPSKAFKAISKTIKDTMDKIYRSHRSIFANPRHRPSRSFIEVPDYHGACIVAASTGTPLHKLKPGPKMLHGERIQINKEPLKRYSKALEEFVDSLG
jgi:cellulose biosynthesis protein BcsQ